MSDSTKVEGILERLARREITPRQAIAELVTRGFNLGDAGETVLFALGGSDLIETGPDGRERYHDSGRLVSEVANEMSRRPKIRLTKDQKLQVEKCVAQGWPREAAELMVVEAQEDVVEGNTPPPKREV